jgi:hypothetical protein
MKRLLIFLAGVFTIQGIVYGQYSIKSPGSLTKANIEIGPKITYGVYFQEKPVLTNSEIGFVFHQAPPLGLGMEVVNVSEREINETWTPVLKRKSAVANHCNELKLELKEKKFPHRLNRSVVKHEGCRPREF